jgi:pimeloyl-ACP methyl ester carboxylesterase
MVGYSRLIGLDDAGTLVRLRALRRNLIDPAISEHGGRIVQTGGDSLLIVFDSIDGAVRCAVKVQKQVPIHDADKLPDRTIRFRIGINIGDAIADGTDLHGDAVNVVARLQAECPPGGICVARSVRDHVHGRLDLAFEELGALNLKNIARPVEAFALKLASSGFAAVRTQQEIRYCRTPDGVRLAYAIVGEGPPLVRCGRWFTHLEYEWREDAKYPVAILKDLATEFRILRYDARGTGLSDWEVGEIFLEAWVADLETVVNAAGFERFALLGESQGSAIAMAYAARHPERVSKLILCGGYALGWRKRRGAQIEQHEALMTLMRVGWDNPSYRQVFSSQFMPEGTKEQWDAFTELEGLSTSGECAARYYDATGDFDVTDLLPRIATPTLVTHVREDLRVPFELGRQLANGIPGARFVALPGRSHALMDDSGALERYLEEVRLFLAQEAA